VDEQRDDLGTTIRAWISVDYLIAWNRTWAALMGDPSVLAGRDRNLIWRHFSEAGGTGSHGHRQRPAHHRLHRRPGQ
jgi:MmyB-like transcription regulator ligand binding domain